MMQNITSAPHKDKQPHRPALPSRERQQSIKQQVVETVRAALTQVLEQALRAEVVTLLGRVKSQRRDLADVVAVKATCNRCHRSLRRNFYRDGSYPRSLLTGPAYVRIRVPRLSCTCGGTVDHQFTLFAPYQRVWFDLQARARQLAGLCVSLRDSLLRRVFDSRGACGGERPALGYWHAQRPHQRGSRPGQGFPQWATWADTGGGGPGACYEP